MLSGLIIGGIYKIRARNFSLGVFDGDGFIGLRQKFDAVFLFKEFAWEQGPPFGTVPEEPRELVGQVLPGVPLVESGITGPARPRCCSTRNTAGGTGVPVVGRMLSPPSTGGCTRSCWMPKIPRQRSGGRR